MFLIRGKLAMRRSIAILRPTPLVGRRSSLAPDPDPAGSAVIGAPAIIILRKSPRINHLKISNRHKTDSSAACHPTSRKARISARRFPRGTSHELRSTALIGPPVIRIRPKPFVFNTNVESNRLKTAPFAIKLLRLEPQGPERNSFSGPAWPEGPDTQPCTASRDAAANSASRGAPAS